MSKLPYTDTKSRGAADFYFAINATFRFIISRHGMGSWISYLKELGHTYYEPVNVQWREGGLAALAEYWRAFFAAEPEANVHVVESPDRIEIHVRKCPAIWHLRAAGRAIVPQYCQHCYHLGSARAEAAGFTMRLNGGNGSCCHTYARMDSPIEAQDIDAIREARL